MSASRTTFFVSGLARMALRPRFSGSGSITAASAVVAGVEDGCEVDRRTELQRFYRPAEAPRAQVRARHAQRVRADYAKPKAWHSSWWLLARVLERGIHQCVFQKAKGLALNFLAAPLCLYAPSRSNETQPICAEMSKHLQAAAVRPQCARDGQDAWTPTDTGRISAVAMHC